MLAAILILAVIGGAVFTISKLRNKKVATIEYKSGEETTSRELSYDRDFNLGDIGCRFDIHVVCKKGENGLIEYQLRSPSTVIWIAKAGEAKKELSEAFLSENDGEYLLFESKTAMNAFARIVLSEITD